MTAQHEHGTPKGRLLHRLNGTVPCVECCDAHNDQRRAWRVMTGHSANLLVPVATLVDLLNGAATGRALTAALGEKTVAALRSLRRAQGKTDSGSARGESVAVQQSRVRDATGRGCGAHGAADKPEAQRSQGLQVRRAPARDMASHEQETTTVKEVPIDRDSG
jgi:hypothetical protein